MPHQRSGVTSKVSSPSRSVPDQQPVWARRRVSKVTRSNERMKWRGSSKAGMAPSKTTSISISCGFGSTITRRRFSPSSTSTRIGPTRVSMRSAPSSRDARTTRWMPLRVATANASCTDRFGYWPSPMTTKSSSLEACRLK